MPRRIINGIGYSKIDGVEVKDSAENAANGIGCLAAQFVAHAKDGIGGIYLCAPLVDGMDSGVSYVYRVKGNRADPLVIEVDDFKGSVAEFVVWCAKE